MSDPNRPSKAAPVPPPAPPLPPPRSAANRPGVLQRLVAPLGFGFGTRPPSGQAHPSADAAVRGDASHIHSYAPLPSQTSAHKTGIPIAALDINSSKTHAVLAGKDILKTVRISDRKVTEEFNLRSAITSYTSARGTSNSGPTSARRRDFLPAVDVKWSHGQFDNVIATAANHGRIALYDLQRPEVELAWLHEHSRQVHKLGFDPHKGYLLLSGAHDGTVKLWDLRVSTGERSSQTIKSFRQFHGRADAVRDLRWSPTEAFEFVMCTDGGVIQVWDIRHPDVPKLRLNGHEKACYSVDWHPDGRHVVSGGADKYVRVWDVKEDRRQKPCFQLRAPQAIRNIRWRPPCWSAELAGTGDWESTQLATGYSQDDPRVHVWDFRRPNIPFRELDRYNSPATDLLWCNKDLLWTVGNEGMFTQTDVQFAPQVHDQLKPCAMTWLPSGEYSVFVENRGPRRRPGMDDPSVGFLSISHDKLSSGEHGALSRSMTDDEIAQDGFLSASFRRRQSKTTSGKSSKSYGNTPPSREEELTVLSLEKAVLERKRLYKNKQVGVIGELTGTAMDAAVVEYLAENYARALTEPERKMQPGVILQRLEAAFKTNADACDDVAMYRLGQTWRILGAVIVPELKEWADRNRSSRLSRNDGRDQAKSDVLGSSSLLVGSASFDYGSDQIGDADAAEKTQKLMGNLFKGVMESRAMTTTEELDSTSNVTTPMMRPLPDSPLLHHTQSSHQHQPLMGAVDTAIPLPPSVMAAHSTAAAASRALQDDAGDRFDTPSSPENIVQNRGDASIRKDRRMDMSDAMQLSPIPSQEAKSAPQAIQAKRPGRPRAPTSSARPLREEEKRAALRDYKAQARPLVTFDEPGSLSSTTVFPGVINRHDSTESMLFGVSTDSSHKGGSIDLSFESPDDKQLKTSLTPEDWHLHKESFEPSSPHAHINHTHRFSPAARTEYYSNTKLPDFGTDGTSEFAFGFDGAVSSQPSESYTTGSDPQDSLKDYDVVNRPRQESSDLEVLPTSVSPEEPFHFEQQSQPLSRSRVLSNGRLSQMASRKPVKAETTPSPPLTDLDMNSPDYIITDFQQIGNFRPGVDEAPLAWSSLPLIAQAIAFDVVSGQACAQFSTHLLMHVHPYFFNQKHRRMPQHHPAKSKTLADRLMNPLFSYRIIESIFLNHCEFLQKEGLYVYMAELRNLCVDFDYPAVFNPTLDSEDSLNSGDPSFLFITCANCHAPLQASTIVCSRCKTPRDPCPICLSLRAPLKRHIEQSTFAHQTVSQSNCAMWTFCHGCGHGAHESCMGDWLGHPYSGGECPSIGCGHDCGPGRVREERLEHQAAEEADAKLVRPGANSSPRKDTWKVPGSAAVERTRRVLRDADAAARGGRGSSAGGAGGGPRKVVRLVTPGEEDEG